MLRHPALSEPHKGTVSAASLTTICRKLHRPLPLPFLPGPHLFDTFQHGAIKAVLTTRRRHCATFAEAIGQ